MKHIRRASQIALVTSAAGCWNEPAEQASARASLDLGAAFEVQPWTDQGQRRGALRLQGQFELPDARVLAGSALVLEGAWWSVDTQINGQMLATQTGGLAPVTIPVGGHLKEGTNTISLSLQPPPAGTLPLLTGGGLESGGQWRAQQADLAVAPRLELRPVERIESVAFPLRDGKVSPTARTSGVGEGAQVRFSVARDGDRLASLGSAPVRDGLATAASTSWPLEPWLPGAPALYIAQAELVAADGRVLDRFTHRTGAMGVVLTEQGLRVSDEPLRLIAVRVTRQDPGPAARFAELRASGVNGVEFHGELASSQWLNTTDELGLPAVVVPRCIGRSNKGNPTQSILHQQTLQDERFATHLSAHPSPVLWATEGQSADSQKTRPGTPKVLWTDGLRRDLLARPVSQEDFPGRVQRVGATTPNGAPQDSCLTEGCRRAWLTEITWRGRPVSNLWEVMAERMTHALTQGGAIGGVIPAPASSEVGRWAPVWNELATRVGAEQLSGGPFRATSRVQFVNGRPGETVFVEAAGHPTVGTVLDARGQGEVRLWHEGAAEVVTDAARQAVKLDAGRWVNWVEQSKPVVVSLSAQ